ncbi:unnamed protein product [Rotaria sp. Silwood2]|nr:unnamed protein product [Rotaria sp. Silwood2]
MDTEQDSITIWFDGMLPNDSASTTITIKRAVHFALCKVDPYLRTFRDLDKFSKVRCVHTDLNLLCNELNQISTIRRQRHQRPTVDDFNIYSLSCLSDSSTSTVSSTQSLLLSNNNTQRQEAEYMYSLLLRGILIRADSTEEEMISFFRHICNNNADLETIEQFETYYEANNAIFWYTRDTFLYRILNKAWREEDVKTLYSMRYFIKDIHLQLLEKHILQQRALKDTPTNDIIYRGQLMKTEEFNRKIRHNVGGLFSVVSFFSTTMDENLASVYAGNSENNHQHLDVEHVLFQIKIDKNVYRFSYANISKQSAFEKGENEILFNIGAIFRIESINQDDRKVWIVHLKLTDDEDRELKKRIGCLETQILTPYPQLNLGRLMVEMGNYSAAEEYYLSLFENKNMIKDLAYLAGIYNELGQIYQQTGEKIKAIECFSKTINVELEHLLPTHRNLARLYCRLGKIHHERGDYKAALINYHEALDIELNQDRPEEITLAKYYHAIGEVYYVQGRYTDALIAFEKCLTMQLKILPKDYSDLATTYTNIGLIHYRQFHYDAALDFFKKTLSIQLTLHPSQCPWLSKSYGNIAWTLYQQDKFIEALNYMKKAYEIAVNNFSVEHEHSKQCQQWIVELEENLARTTQERK